MQRRSMLIALLVLMGGGVCAAEEPDESALSHPMVGECATAKEARDAATRVHNALTDYRLVGDPELHMLVLMMAYGDCNPLPVSMGKRVKSAKGSRMTRELGFEGKVVAKAIAADISSKNRRGKTVHRHLFAVYSDVAGLARYFVARKLHETKRLRETDI